MDRMKKSALPAPLLISLLLAFTACKEKAAEGSGTKGSAAFGTHATAPAQVPVEGELAMTAQLMEIPGSFPANDLYNYAYVMKYKVLKVTKGSYPDADILIGHYNPRFARADIKDEQAPKVGGNVKSFQVGDIHYLVLSPLDGLWTGSVEDDYFKDKRPRYWALWADKAE